MNEIEALTKRLDLLVEAVNTLRKLTELNSARIANLELHVFPQEER